MNNNHQNQATKSLGGTAAPSRHDVEKLAYSLYLERGGEAGRANEDWLEAERELSGPTSLANAEAQTPSEAAVEDHRTLLERAHDLRPSTNGTYDRDSTRRNLR